MKASNVDLPGDWIGALDLSVTVILRSAATSSMFTDSPQPYAIMFPKHDKNGNVMPAIKKAVRFEGRLRLAKGVLRTACYHLSLRLQGVHHAGRRIQTSRFM